MNNIFSCIKNKFKKVQKSCLNGQNEVSVPYISIIVPCYNVQEYLQECLDSLINQTFKNFEIICINDGSHDNTLQILKDYESKDKRIVVIDKENEGLSAARNLGMKISKAPYIFFMDSDDWLDKDAFELMYEKIIKYDLDLVCIPYKKHYLNNETTTYKFFKCGKIKINDKLSRKIPPLPWAKLYKKSIIQESGCTFVLKQPFEDAIFWIMISPHLKNAFLLDGTYYNYREREGSFTLTFSKKDNPFVFTNTVSKIKDYFMRDEAFFKKHKKYLIKTIYNLYRNDYEMADESDRQMILDNIYKNVIELNLNKISNEKFIEHIIKKDFSKIKFVKNTK